MKRILLFLSLSMVIFNVNSQENWLFSPDLGVNIIPVDDGSVSGISYKMGASFGFSAHNVVEDNWVFNYGISFNKRFASYSYSSESDELSSLLPDIIGNLGVVDLTIYESTKGFSSYWTFDVPISVSYKFGSGFLFYGGGYINFLMSVRNDEEYNQHIPIFEAFDPEELGLDPELTEFLPQNETTTTTNDSKSNFNELDYGVIGGLGYQSENWLFKLGYQHGFNDIGKDDFKFNMRIQNQRAIQLSVSYLLRDLFLTSKNEPRYDLDLIE